MAETFQDFIKSERTRLNTKRRSLIKQQEETAKQLAIVDRELAAIAAYETTKTGKAEASKPAAPTTRRRAVRAKPATTRGRRDSKREPILKLVADNPSGLTRGEILTKLGLKGDKPGEMSVSNALTALSKSNRLAREDGKYVPVQA